MRRPILLLLLMLVVFSVAAWAKAGDPGSDKQQAPARTTASVINGCLQRSGFQYTLIDTAGKSHLLIGNTGKLGHFTGHQVAITGQPTIKTIDTTEPQAASTAEEIPAFEVKTIKLISKTCSSSQR